MYTGNYFFHLITNPSCNKIGKRPAQVGKNRERRRETVRLLYLEFCCPQQEKDCLVTPFLLVILTAYFPI